MLGVIYSALLLTVTHLQGFRTTFEGTLKKTRVSQLMDRYLTGRRMLTVTVTTRLLTQKQQTEDVFSHFSRTCLYPRARASPARCQQQIEADRMKYVG